MDTKDTRYWLLFLVIFFVSIFLIIKLNSYQKCTPPPPSEKEILSKNIKKLSNSPKIPSISFDKETTLEVYNQPGLKTIVTNIQDEPNQTRFKYEYRIWPERDFLDTDNYEFYSMYGWRTIPPYQYPQKTIDTAYNEAIENCFCAPEEGNEKCLQDCRFKALEKSGFPSIFRK